MIMNKKVSTIFAMAALMGGSLFSSAYAENISELTDGAPSTTELTSQKLFLKVGNAYVGAQWEDENLKEVIEYLKAPTTDINKEDLAKYLWTVSGTKLPGDLGWGYIFTNVETGEAIRFERTDGETAGSYKFTVLTADKEDADIDQYLRINDGEEWEGEESNFSIAGYDTEYPFAFADEDASVDPLPVAGSEITAEGVSVYKLKPGIDVDVTDLNKLYNSAGFNFKLNDDKLADVSNIFGNKRIIAIEVPENSIPETTTKGVKDPERKGYGFPAGTYFITAGSVKNKTNPTYNELVNCTFIAIDSDNNISGEEDDQKAGLGFTLTEVSGKDLVLYLGTDDKYKASGDQIAVQNAAFTVKESTTTSELYDLKVNARYVEASSAAKQVEKEVSISAVKGDAQLQTVAKGNHYIFKFTESSAVKPSTLLFKGDTASIYNIRLYKANGADDTRNGKYLTTTPSKQFVAKGAVLADTETPAYQWVISNVDGSNVTFKNRETGKELTTQLFDEGNGIYSLSEYVATPGTESTYTFYNVNEKGNVELGYEYNNPTFYFNYNTKIQLIPSKAVNYSGYLNVEDETLMTLSFGRDIAPTSNKLYPYVTVNGTSYSFEPNESLTNKVSDAAQWVLVKNPKGATAIKYNYVYANGNLINTKNNGDVVYANSYGFQLVLDGKVIKDNTGKPYYLNLAGNSAPDVTTTPKYYFIQENVDGSVSIMDSHADTEALLLTSYTKNPEDTEDQSIDALIKQSFKLQDITTVESYAYYVKTYLIAEAPAVSLPAVEGHYSFVSEFGNYITMNEDRDGLTVKEESEPMYLYVTDEEEVVPSFYITKGVSPVEGQRMYLFNPTDSVDYYVATGTYDKKYQWTDEVTKAIFKSAAISESRDTLTTEIKGESTLVAQEASNAEKVEGGLDMFKMQIIEDPESDGLYVVRNVADKSQYLYSWNGMLAWGNKTAAMKFNITGAEAPTANEGVSATEVKVIATDGAINIKNAAGKNVVISTILGQIVANEVLTSDNATISVPAGIAIVSVDGEEAVKVSVK